MNQNNALLNFPDLFLLLKNLIAAAPTNPNIHLEPLKALMMEYLWTATIFTFITERVEEEQRQSLGRQQNGLWSPGPTPTPPPEFNPIAQSLNRTSEPRPQGSAP